MKINVYHKQIDICLINLKEGLFTDKRMDYTTTNTKISKRILYILNNCYSACPSDAQVYLNTLANNNKVYLVKAKGVKYILRESNELKSLEHLKLECKVLTFLHKINFHLTPYIISNKNGKLVTVHDKKKYVLENFLPGRVKKNVNNLKDFNDKKINSLFSALADFSRTTRDFTSAVPKNNKTISYYIKNGSRLLATTTKKIKTSAIIDLLKKNTSFVISFINETQRQLQTLGYDSLQKQIVHFDMHPGNVNYIGDKLSGIFDFDWVRFDNRFADLACTIGQSCYHYHGKNRTFYDKNKIKIGLTAYRESFGKSEYSLRKECKILKAALRGYMFFQLLWIIEWHINNSRDKKGYEFIKFSLDVLRNNDFDHLLD